MTTITKSAVLAAMPNLHEPTLPHFWPGQLVVLAGEQPLVCVVLEETYHGMLRLSRAAWPEDHLLVSASEVQHLAGWLTAQLGRAGDRERGTPEGG